MIVCMHKCNQMRVANSRRRKSWRKMCRLVIFSRTKCIYTTLLARQKIEVAGKNDVACKDICI